MPPSRADLQKKLDNIENVTGFAQQVAAEDAAGAGLTIEDGAGEGEAIETGISIRGLTTPKTEKKAVSHLLRLDAETNRRLENVLNHLPRQSKQKVIIHALKEFMDKVERHINERKKQ